MRKLNSEGIILTYIHRFTYSMETRFAHLYKRDFSVSMMRVKMSRRRSQCQKENRERMQNLRRCLDQLPESELSMDVSTLEKSVITAQEIAHKTKAGNSAAEQRKKMLAHFKEQKALQKEKERREKEKKGVFKVGLYRPQPLGYVTSNPVVPFTAKATVSIQSTRVTRSMKQQPQQKLIERQVVQKKVEPAVRAPAARSSSRSMAATVMARGAVKHAADLQGVKTRSASRLQAAPSAGREKTIQAGNTGNVPAAKNKPAKEEVPPVTPSLHEEAKIVEKGEMIAASFAPQDFVFQAPAGLRAFQPEPLSPRSADSFLSPSLSFEPKLEPTLPSPLPPASPTSTPPCLPPGLPSTSPASASSPVASAPPPPAPQTPPPAPRTPPPASISPPSSPLEPEHDVSYFRAVMASETERLTGLSEIWEMRFEDSSIPDEMRDRMRTAVGQARLLMKERFGQFGGLVDDCDLGRGEKITTCSDLQGFWDMVYFQVEDVNKKFIALKEAETRGWQEETKTVTKQKKVLKKPPVAGCKPGAGGGSSAAAKSRLAAVKAAMKAKQAAAVKATTASATVLDEPPSAPDAPAAQTVVFHGGFFQVESPAKVVGAVRRSSRLSAAPLPRSFPCVSKLSTPGSLHRSSVIPCASPLPLITNATPTKVAPSTATPACTPQRPADSFPCSPDPLQISPMCLTLSPAASPRASRTERSPPDTTPRFQSDLTNAPADTPVSRSAEIQPRDYPLQTEAELPLQIPEHLLGAQPKKAVPESDTGAASSHDHTEEPIVPELPRSPAVNPAAGASPVRSGSLSLSHSPVSKAPPQAESLELRASALSPSMMFTTPHVLSLSDSAGSSNSKRTPTSTNFEMTESPDAEHVADLDFERYLQPTDRCSLTPVQGPGVERFSLGAVDVEMESPISQAEESTQRTPMTSTALPLAPLVFTPGTEQLMDNQLLFTPEQRNRVRQSVCDLMMFTPPSSK
ncbi:disks large-associated protein 5 isoform X2 [Brachyhypopomus gauderio]|uniref:disks large-associated protein 5 isoform X2 n=1 Tax=Brachyhypopomus gauderio TaxID=698409 RepID=UPI0040420495